MWGWHWQAQGGARGWRETKLDWFPRLSCINYTALLYFPCFASVVSVFALGRLLDSQQISIFCITFNPKLSSCINYTALLYFLHLSVFGLCCICTFVVSLFWSVVSLFWHFLVDANSQVTQGLKTWTFLLFYLNIFWITLISLFHVQT